MGTRNDRANQRPSLGKEFSLAHGVSSKGNFEDAMSVLALQDGDYTVRDNLKDARNILLKYREENRNLPTRDDSANRLELPLVVALAEAGFYMNRKDWVEKARHIVDFIDSHLFMNESDDFLLSSVYYQDSDKRVPGFLHGSLIIARLIGCCRKS